MDRHFGQTANIRQGQLTPPFRATGDPPADHGHRRRIALLAIFGHKFGDPIGG
jgi:hypothetical protein